MPVSKGKGSNAKITYIRPLPDEGNDSLLWLTSRQRDTLLVLSEQLDWDTRWLDIPENLEDKDIRQEWVDSIKLRLMQMVDFCSQMIDCITNDTDVQDAITNVYNQYNGGNPLPTSVRGKNIVGQVTDCDRDKIYGALVEIIDNMNQNNIDFFENFESISNAAERMALVIGGIPVFETLPIDEAIDYAQSIFTDDLFEAYLSNDTLDYRVDLKCDLLCLAINNGCSLTIELLFQYFLDRIGAGAISSFVNVMSYLALGTWVGTQINDIFYAAQLAAMYFGNQFGGIVGISDFEMYAAIGIRNPSSDWELECDDCDNCIVWDFILDPYMWTLITGEYGVRPGGGENAYFAEIVGSELILELQYDFLAPTRINRIEILTSHADMTISVTTDDGDIVLNQYRAAAGENIVYTVIIEAANWLNIKMVRNVPDSVIILGTVKMFYNGDVISDGELCE